MVNPLNLQKNIIKKMMCNMFRLGTRIIGVAFKKKNEKQLTDIELMVRT
jgi:hypothetical protein